MLAGSATLTGCTRGPQPVGGVTFTQVTLPAAARGRVAVRDVTACPGHWYAVGGYQQPGGGSIPAVWSSTDGSSWRAVAVRPRTFYGRQHLLTSVACRGDVVVAVGSAAGGVHGNLRTGTWIATGGGPLTEVPAAFELFGGPQAIGVGQLTAGPAGWLLGGARIGPDGRDGPAVWSASDGRSFTLVDDDPALHSGAGQNTLTGVAADPGGGFVGVGSLSPTGSLMTRRPAAWRSPTGRHWVRFDVAATGEDDDLEAVTAYRQGLLAVGLRGNGFGAWQGSADRWQAVGRFGTLGGTALPFVSGLAVHAGTVFAVVSDGSRYRLWRSTDAASWQELAMPGPVAAGGSRVAALAGFGARILIGTDDGVAGRLWVGTILG